MRSSGESQQFNRTMIITIIVAGILTLGVIGLVYGCMKANNAPKLKGPVGMQQIAISSWQLAKLQPGQINSH